MHLGHITEEITIIPLFNPIDLQGASGGHVTSDWVKMIGPRARICFYKTNGTAGDDPTCTLLQATDNAGSGSKALGVATYVYRKEEVAANLLTTANFTRTTQAAGSSTYTHGTAAESSLLWIFEFSATDMDVDGGFKFFSMTVADVGGNAQLGCAWAEIEVYYAGNPANHETALS